MVAMYTQKNKIHVGEQMLQRLLLIFIVIMSCVVLITAGIVAWSLRTRAALVAASSPLARLLQIAMPLMRWGAMRQSANAT